MSRYEHRAQPLLPPRQFGRRVARHGGAALAVLLVSLGGGTLGYRLTEGMSWVDALLNAAMILTGMGPATPLRNTAGKLFASGYALYSGVVFLVVAGLLVAPFVHRLLHRLHVDEPKE
ncbi:MAG TPA: hypothetical protein VLA95_07200 [Gemmatimonadales bacterium]|nr:hypothetical protein [Gemmatimonadales bacterium]